MEQANILGSEEVADSSGSDADDGEELSDDLDLEAELEKTLAKSSKPKVGRSPVGHQACSCTGSDPVKWPVRW